MVTTTMVYIYIYIYILIKVYFSVVTKITVCSYLLLLADLLAGKITCLHPRGPLDGEVTCGGR